MNSKVIIHYFLLVSIILGAGFVIWYFFFSTPENIPPDATINNNTDTGMSVDTTGNVVANVVVPNSNIGFEAANNSNLFNNSPSQPVYVQANNANQITQSEPYSGS